MDSISETALTRCCLNQLKPYTMEKLMFGLAILLGGGLAITLLSTIVILVIDGFPTLSI
jgi:hypothetical protein